MNRFLSIGEAAERLGVSITTLRRWEALGRLVPKRTQAGHRRYDAALIESLYGAHAQEKTDGRTIAYARVSSSDQKADLEKQKEILELFCTGRGWRFEMISDLGSGMNYHKKGLVRLLNILVNEDVERLVITQKDRLLRFGAELVFAVCEAKNVEVVIVNKGSDASFDEDLAQDMLEIITIFNARLYGSRNGKNQQLIHGMHKVLRETERLNG